MRILLFAFILTLSFGSIAQDTFSIVAVDPETGEIGGAGASCIDDSQITGGVLIINDIIPGRGAIHTQSYWNPTNQQNAHDRMLEGMSPEQIIFWLAANDVQNNPGIRQYGIVDFDEEGQPRSFGYTGVNCLDYKNHVTGPNYSIQGNILLGQEILDSMEVRFLETEGSLAEKLMAALQGANVPGADTRCAGEGVSSLSSFIRVAKPGDTLGTYYCDLVVPSTPYGVEPIDSLQVLFDEWLNWVGVQYNKIENEVQLVLFPNPAEYDLFVRIDNMNPVSDYQLIIFATDGRIMEDIKEPGNAITLNKSKFTRGIYIYTLIENEIPLISGKFSVIR